MQVTCTTCNKTVTLSNEPKIVSVVLCPTGGCEFKPSFFYEGHRGTIAYWRTRDEEGTL